MAICYRCNSADTRVVITWQLQPQARKTMESDENQQPPGQWPAGRVAVVWSGTAASVQRVICQTAICVSISVQTCGLLLERGCSHGPSGGQQSPSRSCTLISTISEALFSSVFDVNKNEIEYLLSYLLTARMYPHIHVQINS